MSHVAYSIEDVRQRIGHRGSTLRSIDLSWKHLTDADVAELVDCLLAHPDVVTHIWLVCNHLTDETGVKLARYLSVSSSIVWLDLSHNQLGEATYLALAEALRINTSLQYLVLFGNQMMDKSRIDSALINALILNPNLPIDSIWRLYSWDNEFKRLEETTEELRHPSMQATQLVRV